MIKFTFTKTTGKTTEKSFPVRGDALLDMLLLAQSKIAEYNLKHSLSGAEFPAEDMGTKLVKKFSDGASMVFEIV